MLYKYEKQIDQIYCLNRKIDRLYILFKQKIDRLDMLFKLKNRKIAPDRQIDRQIDRQMLG